MTERLGAGTEVIRFVDAAPTPWLAGGGVTRELLRHPSSGDRFDWRLSVADVTTSGPFSPLPGIDRVLTFCDGPAMAITVAGRRHDLVRWEPIAFSGDATTYGHVASPTRDLNVMTRRGAIWATVQVVEIGEMTLMASGDQTVVAVVLEGTMTLRHPGIEAAADLVQFDAVRLQDDAHVTVIGSGRAQVVTFRGAPVSS
ncbi:MAG: hypothetical protein JWQ70_1183 [Aeromicrobium sp.]|nr:hypothetical protein [Aeromicrobium sp.]